MKYQVGQYVMYRNNGVCRVEAVGKLGFLPGSDKAYYTLRPPFASGYARNYIPTTAEDSLRAVISPEEAKEYLAKLAKMDAKPYSSRKRQLLIQHYEKLLSSRDLDAHLQLLKEVSVKSQAERNRGKKLPATDEGYQRKVEQLLSEEFAVAFQETPEVSRERLHAVLYS